MSVDNFRVYDIRMLPAQEIKTIYDAFIFPLQDTTCHVWNCISAVSYTHLTLPTT